MFEGTPETDGPAKAYVEAMLPEECIPLGLITILAYQHPERDMMSWRLYNDSDLPISSILGLVELAKLELVGRCYNGGFEFGIEHENDDT